MNQPANLPGIPVAKPWMGREEEEALARVIRSGWVTQGPEVAAFEKEFATFTGAPFACAVSSCTAALHLALLVAGVKPGDEVITVSHSFIATVNSILYCGAIPVFCDIDPATQNMDVERLEGLVTEKTRAILCVHQMGMPADLRRIVSLARARRLMVVEDAACAVGSRILNDGEWQPIGRPHGDIACFSFHPRKILTTGDGGMLTTASPAWDERFRALRQHGMSISDLARHRSSAVLFESYDDLGFNYRMTDLEAAVGRVQLRRLPEMIERRRLQAWRYIRDLAPSMGFAIQKEPEWAQSNRQSFSLRLPDGWDQRRVMEFLQSRGVASRRGVMCAHREPGLSSRPWQCEKRRACACGPGECEALRHSEEAQDRTILLPLYNEMTDEEQDRVIAALLDFPGGLL
jgi:dTDP-4-amino-4,6-dideoxygalactose transaminase